MFELNNFIQFEKYFEKLVTYEFQKLYTEHFYEKLSEQFLKTLNYYADFQFLSLSGDDYYRLNIFLENFLNLFIQKDFIIPNEHMEKYLKYNSLIANLVFLSGLRTTDRFITTLLNHKLDNFTFGSRNEIVKILTIYSIRNNVSLNYHCLFRADPEASSFWYWQYFGLADFSTGNNCLNIENHMDYIKLLDEKAIIPPDIKKPFFHSTYAHQYKDKNVKSKINSLIQNRYKNIKICNESLPVSLNKIAVISGLLYPGHPVFRGTYKYIEALAESYELTLINLSGSSFSHLPNIFKNEISLKLDTDSFDLSKIPDNFVLACYPDIGMTSESIFLSNLRIAPIQVNFHGHSVSTHGSKIDYFISGLKSENIEKARENYSERLVLLPGIGLHPVDIETAYYRKIEYSPIKTATWKKEEPFLIACPWSYVKINNFHLQSLLKIKKLAEKNIIYRFFPSSTTNSKIFSFCLDQELNEIFGKENLEIMDFESDLDKYLNLVSETEILIDSFHFGGYTTIIDALYIGKPVITIDGEKAYNKFAAALLKTLNLEELIAVNEQEYIDKVLELINNDNYRRGISLKIKKSFQSKALFNDAEPLNFKKAIDYLIQNNETLKKEISPEPIFIK